MGINYDPNTNVGFHSDGSPVQIDLSLSFQEIKFQISKDNATGQNLNLSGPVLQAQSARQQSANEFTDNRLSAFAATGDTSRGF